MVRVVVDVMLKPEILDPQGRAVRGALSRHGLTNVADVRQGKQFVIELAGSAADLDHGKLHDLAANLLANPVIENYRISVDGGDAPTEVIETSITGPSVVTGLSGATAEAGATAEPGATAEAQGTGEPRDEAQAAAAAESA